MSSSSASPVRRVAFMIEPALRAPVQALRALGSAPLLSIVVVVAVASIAGARPAGAAKNQPRIHPECVRVRDHARAMRFRAADGLRLAGVLLGKGATGVVLAHQIRSDLCEWMPFARVLASNGFRVLAFDFRGYGASSPGAGRLTKAADVVAAARALRSQGVRDVALIGGRWMEPPSSPRAPSFESHPAR